MRLLKKTKMPAVNQTSDKLSYCFLLSETVYTLIQRNSVCTD